jgi:AAA family ATP:ADP antiporter
VTPAARLAEWLDVRPHEIRLVLLAFSGAFLMMAFVVLARALREAFFLDIYDASSLPYVGGASIGLGLLAAAVFSRAVAERTPQSVMRIVVSGLAVSMLLLHPFLAEPGELVIVFYLLTAVGTLILTSGFWLVISELFAVREAKRLFGLISAGGTLGLLAAGLSMRPLLALFEPRDLLFVLSGLLALGLLVNEALPRDRLGRTAGDSGRRPSTPAEGLRLLLSVPHVRLIAGIFLLVSAASAVVDYQFKEAVQGSLGGGPQMAVFFGDFYAWTGGLALLIQLLVTTRLLATVGIAGSVALVPLVVASGSVAMLVAPGLLVATGLRGADSTLRKSVFRSVMEFLWVPVPHEIRRRTKTFVDSFADAVGEGLGVLVVFLWVTLPGLPSRWLSVFVIAICSLLLVMSGRIGREYFRTLRSRVASADSGSDLLLGVTAGDSRGHTLSRIDITRVLGTSGIPLEPARGQPLPEGSNRRGDADDGAEASDPDTVLRSHDVARIAELLREGGATDPDLVPALARLLARDPLREAAARTLIDIGHSAVSGLRVILNDPSADFVIRRRIPSILDRIPDAAAEEALVEALEADRFEVRYRAAAALVRRRQSGHPTTSTGHEGRIWSAIRSELGRGRAVWELARLLDDVEPDSFVERRVDRRGHLSLEHVFRLLGLARDPDAIQAAWRALLSDQTEARSFALEYLDQVLPADVRERLWPFIGDLSADRERRAIRPIDDVVADLVRTGATLFGAGEDRDALRRYLAGSPEPDARRVPIDEDEDEAEGKS